MRWTDLREYGGFVRELVSHAQAAAKAGRTVDEAVGSLTLAERYPGYEMSSARTMVQRVYDELK
jgi:hypothetical protein